jgi:hypothetical protein
MQIDVDDNLIYFRGLRSSQSCHIKMRRNKFMSTTKEKVKSLLSKLPDDCSLEEIQYHLYVFQKVCHSLEVAETEGTIPQEEVERRLNKWLIK